ncbi:MAG TPA: hypothetical protein IAA27_00940 [Candidatus Enterococcus stercoravium]|nr:hypothetical protein [Candidatus Enterococcus stercoravium]
MNKQEVIKILEKKRETALDNYAYYRDKENEKYEKMNQARVDSYTLAIQLVEQIEEPQAEKVEVPSCMGIFLDSYPDKEETAMHIVMHDFTKSEYFSEFAEIPLANYPMGWDRLMASALMFGYTVEQPKRWVVRTSSAYFEQFSGDSNHPFNFDATHNICVALTFTDRKKAEAVAILIGGTVEEA